MIKVTSQNRLENIMKPLADKKYALDEMRSILDMVRWVVSQFNQCDLTYGHGTENSLDEAANLVLSALHLPPDTDRGMMTAALTSKEREFIIHLVERRIKERVPVPYLVNEAWFGGYNFFVDERVIIPRSPVAELIDYQFSPWLDAFQVDNVLDLCTGSGCIAIACALAFDHAQVDAVDISQDALDVAEINVDRYGLEDYVTLIKSNLFESVEPKEYDLIISNPPYVGRETVMALPEEYGHEPTLALEAGEDGLECVHIILREALNYLSPNGVLIVEVGYIQELVEAAYPNLPFTWLQFERGGDGVFLLTARDLQEANLE